METPKNITDMRWTDLGNLTANNTPVLYNANNPRPTPEQLVLSALLNHSADVPEVVNMLPGGCFEKAEHNTIYTAILQQHLGTGPIDAFSVLNQLGKANALPRSGGEEYVMQLSFIPCPEGYGSVYAQMVLEKYVVRKLQAAVTQMQQNISGDFADPFSLINAAITQLDDINFILNRNAHINWAQCVSDTTQQLLNASAHKSNITGVPAFSTALDTHTGGFQPGNLIILAARPAMGKTTIALHMAYQQVKHNLPVGFFSLEMSAEQLAQKVLSSESLLEIRQITNGNVSPNQLQQLKDAGTAIAALPMQMCDTGCLNINQLIATAKMWKHKHDIRILYIDYLQLITTDATTQRFQRRDQEVGYISARLKALAKELHIPIIVLSQLSRAPEGRTDKRPLLSDLRESGAIEQDADMILFPFRPAYYTNPAEKPLTPSEESLTELIIAKYRMGHTGTILWRFDKEVSRMAEWNE
jgi:replicative DNA helicase